jgi:hypothetical protein
MASSFSVMVRKTRFPALYVGRRCGTLEPFVVVRGPVLLLCQTTHGEKGRQFGFDRDTVREIYDDEH